MKKILCNLSLLSILIGVVNVSDAQVKKSKKGNSKKSHTVVVPFVERKYGTPSSVADITDVTATDNSYGSIKNLVEQDKIMVSYDDNTFHSKEPLRRGDFIVSLNSALDALKQMKTNMGVDSNVISPYDRSRASGKIASVADVKDLKESSVYYPAAKSLIENYGVTAPFLSNKTLGANGIMTEKEVFDILHATLGYTSTGANPYAKEITRGKFAIALNNAVLQKEEQIADMHAQAMVGKDAERKAQQTIMLQQQKASQDSMYKAMETQKFAAQEMAAKMKSKKKKG